MTFLFGYHQRPLVVVVSSWMVLIAHQMIRLVLILYVAILWKFYLCFSFCLINCVFALTFWIWSNRLENFSFSPLMSYPCHVTLVNTPKHEQWTTPASYCYWLNFCDFVLKKFFFSLSPSHTQTCLHTQTYTLSSLKSDVSILYLPCWIIVILCY